jgi:hypothetical protein
MNERVTLLVVGFLGIAFLGALGLIGYLAAANPARAIPDVLVGVTTGILGLLGGILIPSGRQAP